MEKDALTYSGQITKVQKKSVTIMLDDTQESITVPSTGLEHSFEKGMLVTLQITPSNQVREHQALTKTKNQTIEAELQEKTQDP